MDIAIIGAGKWGQALYHAFSENNNVVITSRTKKDIENFVSVEEALKRKFLVIAIPSQCISDWMNDNFVDMGQNILVASKGIEIKSGKFLDEIYADFVSDERIAFLSGPSFAAEVVKSLPTALIITSKNTKLAQKFCDALPSFIKGYVSSDVIGAEVGGAYKNVIAIAAGICDGLELGNNARAALISRGLVEMSRLGVSLGAEIETFLSLGGSGDLFLTASSVLSRNYRVGLGLAKGKSTEEILDELGEVAEGIYTTKALCKISNDKNIYLPIAHEVNYILEGGKTPLESLTDLLENTHKIS